MCVEDTANVFTQNVWDSLNAGPEKTCEYINFSGFRDDFLYSRLSLEIPVIRIIRVRFPVFEFVSYFIFLKINAFFR